MPLSDIQPSTIPSNDFHSAASIARRCVVPFHCVCVCVCVCVYVGVRVFFSVGSQHRLIYNDSARTTVEHNTVEKLTLQFREYCSYCSGGKCGIKFL